MVPSISTDFCSSEASSGLLGLRGPRAGRRRPPPLRKFLGLAIAVSGLSGRSVAYRQYDSEIRQKQRKKQEEAFLHKALRLAIFHSGEK